MATCGISRLGAGRRLHPRVPVGDRLVIDELGYPDDGIMHVTAPFGYMDEQNVPAVLRQLATADTKFPIELDTASYFLSTVELRLGEEPTMAPRRKRLLLATAASPPTRPSTSGCLGTAP